MSGPMEPTPTRLRPYSSPSTGGAVPRSQEFGTGLNGDDPGNSPTSAGQDAGLAVNAQQFRAQVSPGVRPTSVLQSIVRNPGGLGMSAADAARRTFDGQYLGSINGTSVSSFEPSAMLRMQGLNSE